MEGLAVGTYDFLELEAIRDAFAEELERASGGGKTSFGFLKTPLPKRTVKDGEAFGAIVVGGSRLKWALVMVRDDTIKILKVGEGAVPKVTSKEAFLKFITRHVQHVHDVHHRHCIQQVQDVQPRVLKLAINLAFPLASVMRDGRLDGVLIQGAKGHRLTDLIGKRVGEQIERYLTRPHKIKVDVSVANDIVCLLLAAFGRGDWHNLAGLVVGTGSNVGFFLDKRTVVNLESANFKRFEQSETGRLVDERSSNPGQHLFEKEFAGGYLFGHYNLIAKRLKLVPHSVSSTRKLSDLAFENRGESGEIARLLLTRSAQLVGAELAGIAQFKKSTSFTFVVEGSLFWKGWRYRETVQKILRELRRDTTFSFINIPDSSIVGASRLLTL